MQSNIITSDMKKVYVHDLLAWRQPSALTWHRVTIKTLLPQRDSGFVGKIFFDWLQLTGSSCAEMAHDVHNVGNIIQCILIRGFV